ncbi:hypothetical protein D5R40_30450 [Okeania hirsuta]|uniref:Uncharacterized protein n=1 Tax=Okeania hirsuta TaxID=1458930 RepID=A0A3N6NVT1_9CYAN|nr:hypothetical protein D4Z78_18095 [Okeania hirsuta]RQH23318.1 hypothetical protein D5R40_30450 [Okeania hirsuta]
MGVGDVCFLLQLLSAPDYSVLVQIFWRTIKSPPSRLSTIFLAKSKKSPSFFQLLPEIAIDIDTSNQLLENFIF